MTERRLDPHQVWWAHAIFHPAKTGKIYTVRQGADGPEFNAYYSHSGIWHEMLPDADGDGTRELGPRLRETQRLHYKTSIAERDTWN